MITVFGLSVRIRPNKKTGEPELVISSSIATPDGEVPSTEIHEVINLVDLAKKELEKDKE